MKKVLITIFLLAFILLPSYTHAQIQSPIDGVTISSFPEDPEPGESTTVSIQSYLFDLNASSIVWLSNGVNIGQGIGMKDIKVNAPQAGKKLTITAITKNPEGREVRKSLIIKSGSVDIVWETDSYTPPFYKGKNTLVFQNKIKLTAMPHLYDGNSRELDARKLVYQWKLGGTFIDDTTGYGSQSISIFAGNVPKPLDISVEVYNKEQTADATNKITINPDSPTIELYEMDPLYGTYFNKALVNRITLKNSEMTLLAAPFGFNFKNNPLTYTWMINYIEQPDLIKNQSITLRSQGGAVGTSNINLDIKSTKSILEGANSSLNIDFSKKDTVDNSSTVTF